MKHYILEGHETKEADLMTWSKWFETANRHVANEFVGETRISTVFLGLDYSFEEDIPLLFETMVFGGNFDGKIERYSTWEEAEKGHKQIVNHIKENS